MAGSTYYLNQGKEQLPYVLNIGFPGQRNDLLLLRLDLEGISISTGSACTAGVVQSVMFFKPSTEKNPLAYTSLYASAFHLKIQNKK